MITEEVNGVLRQVWQFQGGRYYSPVTLGHGYRSQIDAEKSKALISSEAWERALNRAAKAKPAHVPQAVWEKQNEEELFKEALADFSITGKLKGELAVCKILLTPFPGSPDVETWFNELSTEGEVESVINFSNGNGSGSTKTEPLSSESGTATRPRKAGRSNGTSRRATAI